MSKSITRINKNPISSIISYGAVVYHNRRSRTGHVDSVISRTDNFQILHYGWHSFHVDRTGCVVITTHARVVNVDISQSGERLRSEEGVLEREVVLVLSIFKSGNNCFDFESQ